MGRLSAISRIDRVFAIHGKIGIVQRVRGRIPTRGEACRNRLFPERRRRGHEKLMVQKRTAISGMEEAVADRVLLRQFAFGQLRRINVA